MGKEYVTKLNGLSLKTKHKKIKIIIKKTNPKLGESGKYGNYASRQSLLVCCSVTFLLYNSKSYCGEHC